MKLLIVDDSRAMRMMVRRTLRQAGIDDGDVSEAGNGKEALESIKSARPDLVFSDWNMPEMNGIELLEALRAASIDVPFGFVTSESTPEIRARAVGAGAKFLITKPFTPETFKTAIDQVGVK